MRNEHEDRGDIDVVQLSHPTQPPRSPTPFASPVLKLSQCLAPSLALALRPHPKSQILSSKSNGDLGEVGVMVLNDSTKRRERRRPKRDKDSLREVQVQTRNLSKVREVTEDAHPMAHGRRDDSNVVSKGTQHDGRMSARKTSEK